MKITPLLLSALLTALPLQSFAEPETESANWPLIRDSLFPGSPDIVESEEIVSLTAPKRAIDAALVPLEVRVNVRQGDTNPIERIHLIVDNNPSPIVGSFDMSPNNGIANIATRVRVNAYSPVRVIAQTADGKLHMHSKFVKASGVAQPLQVLMTCWRRQRMGRMKLKDLAGENSRMMQLLISHPNYSGLQIDQLTRHWIPSDYVSDVNITLEGEPVMRFNGGISISENPTFTFHLDKGKTGKLKADVKDSTGREFSSEWDI